MRPLPTGDRSGSLYALFCLLEFRFRSSELGFCCKVTIFVILLGLLGDHSIGKQAFEALVGVGLRLKFALA